MVTANSSSFLAEFEDACRHLQDPSKTKDAERLLLALRRSQRPQHACQIVLESSNSESAQFQACLVLRAATLREWTLIPFEEIAALQQFLLRLVIERGAQLSRLVKKQLLQIIATFLRRGWLDDSAQMRDAFFHTVQEWLAGPDVEIRSLGLSVLDLLTQEVASAQLGEVGMDWSLHLRVKKSFEESALLHVLTMALEQWRQQLHLYVQGLVSREDPVMPAALLVLLQVLSWDFSDFSSPSSMMNQRSDSSFRPPLSWRAVLFTPDLTQLFEVYLFVRLKHPQLAHVLRQILIQLCSLTGRVLADDQIRQQYVMYVTAGTSQILAALYVTTESGSVHLNLNLDPAEILDCCQLIVRLTIHFGLPSLCRASGLASLILGFSNVTASLLRQLALCEEENWVAEAVDLCMDAWVQLAKDKPLMETSKLLTPVVTADICSYLNQQSLSVYVNYVTARLEQARRELDKHGGNEDHDQDTVEAETIRAQLKSISVVGRINSESVVALNSFLHKAQQRLQQSSDQFVLPDVWEEIHWLILLASYLLSNVEPSTQLSSVPVKIPDTMLTASASSVRESEDGVITLCCMLLNFCDHIFQLSLTNFQVSPLVVETLLEFGRSFAVSYILPSATDYTEWLSQGVVPVLNRFGGDSGMSYLDLLIRMVVVGLLHFRTEPDVVQNATALLESLAVTTRIKVNLLRCPSWQQVVQLYLHSTQLSLESTMSVPDSSLSCIALVVWQCATAANDSEESKKDRYFSLWKPLQESMDRFFGDDRFASRSQEGAVLATTGRFLQLCIGIAKSTESRNRGFILECLWPWFDRWTVVMHLCRHSGEVVAFVLQFFVAISETQLAYFNSRQTSQFCDSCLNCMRAYSSKQDQLSNQQVAEEDEKSQNILYMLQLLQSLGLKETFDFSEPDGDQREVTSALTGTNGLWAVLLFGLQTILPLLSGAMMGLPSVQLECCRFVTYVAEIYPQRVLSLPQPLFQHLSALLLLASKHPDTRVSQQAAKAFLALALADDELQAQSTPEQWVYFIQLLAILLEQLLSPNSNMDLSVWSDTILALIWRRQGQYGEVAQALCRGLPEGPSVSLLQVCFSKLVGAAGIDWHTLTVNDLTRNQPLRNQFKQSLASFVTEGRALMSHP